MTKLKKLVQQKLLENEFENKPKVRDGVQAPYQHLMDELEYINKKMTSCIFQGDQLEEKLRDLQKNYYDMTIVDEKDPNAGGMFPPWKSSSEYTRNKYMYWNPTTKHLNLSGPEIHEVAIRKEGYEKQIKVLENICKRLHTLDELYLTLKTRRDNIRSELRHKHGKAVWIDPDTNTFIQK